VTWLAVGLASPWLIASALLAFGIREPRRLPQAPVGRGSGAGAESPYHPPVTVILPARNEALHVEACVRSLAAQHYPDFSVIVVDDRSGDGTARLARAVPVDRARSIEVIEGADLPEGWVGKPWACAQGAERASGALLLFTDADTRHGPDLLARTVAALREDGADGLTLIGTQELGSFGERLVQPVIFTLLALRYPRLDRPVEGGDVGGAIANGQYILVSRDAYDAIGGHEGVRAEVVEDLRMAQRLVAGGFRLTVRGAEDAFSTRMYQSLREVVSGWTKNLALGARQSAGWWGRLALPGIVLFLLFWAVPVVLALLFPLVGRVTVDPGSGLSDALVTSSVLAYGVAVLVWGGVYRRFGVSARYGLLFPVAALIAAGIALRSWVRGGRRIEWKGRRYQVEGEASDLRVTRSPDLQAGPDPHGDRGSGE
jgi:chlorobactene glucosyltransferase